MLVLDFLKYEISYKSEIALRMDHIDNNYFNYQTGHNALILKSNMQWVLLLIHCMPLVIFYNLRKSIG